MECKTCGDEAKLDTNGEYWMCLTCNKEIGERKTFYKDISYQPERSKREDFSHCTCTQERVIFCKHCLAIHREMMRCSEHCGNTVRDK